MADFASASAPASIGNVGVGFDVLGQAFDAARDEVMATREEEPGVRSGRRGPRHLAPSPETKPALAAAKRCSISRTRTSVGASITRGSGQRGMGGRPRPRWPPRCGHACSTIIEIEASSFRLEGEPSRRPAALEMCSFRRGLALVASEDPVRPPAARPFGMSRSCSSRC